MKQLTCEMCGGTDLIKQDGVFVCQSCGTKYSVEEAKKMMVEVAGSVKIDTTEKVQNLYVMARRAKDENDVESACKYYEMIIMENPNDWEALFYYNYYKAENTNLKNMSFSVNKLSNAMDGVFKAVYNSEKNDEEKWLIIQEIVAKIDDLCESNIFLAKNHYKKYAKADGTVADLQTRADSIVDLQLNMAALLEKYFQNQSKHIVAAYLKAGVENKLLSDVLGDGFIKITLEYHLDELINIEEQIKEIEPDYVSIVESTQKRLSENEKENSGECQNDTESTQNKSELIQVNYQVGHKDGTSWYSFPNSAGGASVRFAVKNIGTKAIKYYDFCFAPYNAVNDPVECSISGKSKKWVRGTGPLAPNSTDGIGYFSNAWYNPSIASVKLEKAKIEYMDGTKVTLTGDQISRIDNTVKAQPHVPMSKKEKNGLLVGGIIGGILGLILSFWLSSLDASGAFLFFLVAFGGLTALGLFIGWATAASAKQKAQQNNQPKSEQDKNANEKDK